MKKLTLILLSASIIGVQGIANAAPLGKSRSYGMQRSITKQPQVKNNYNNNQANYRNNNNNLNNNTQPTPQRNGVGVGGVLTGAAVGAAAGYMLGSAMHSNDGNHTQTNPNSAPINNAQASQVLTSQQAPQIANSQQNQNSEINPATGQVNTPQNPTSSLPWGTIALLALGLGIGLVLFRKKTATANNTTANNNYSNTPNNQSNFNIPNIKQSTAGYTPGQYSNSQQNTNSVANNNSQTILERMPDGVETVFFLRQVKGMFLHIQSMNNRDNIGEIAKYMTPELYQDISQSIIDNDFVADFDNLECNLIDSTTENGLYIATVEFIGMVSDEPNSPPRPFNEIWNFIKATDNQSSKWLVAGIQQN